MITTLAKDYYSILGVEKSATTEEIRSAYKKLAKKYHPDLNKEHSSGEKFKEINEAAATLGDEKKRAQYDRFGSTSEGFSAGQQGFGFSDSDGFDFSDIFDSFFGGNFSRGDARTRGQDLRHDVEITLEQAATGVVSSIHVNRSESCDKCKGSGAHSESDIKKCVGCNGQGFVRATQRIAFGTFSTTTHCPRCKGSGKTIMNPCKNCHGKGNAQKSRQIEVKIPAGIEDGSRLRITGGGNAADVHGDLYIVIHVSPHEFFEREGSDLRLRLPISFTQAALGAEIDVPVLGGKASLKIPAGTQNGTVLVMRGKGMPDLGTGHKGDQKIKVNVSVPTKLSKKQKELLEEFAKEDRKGLFGKVF